MAALPNQPVLDAHQEHVLHEQHTGSWAPVQAPQPPPTQQPQPGNPKATGSSTGGSTGGSTGSSTGSNPLSAADQSASAAINSFLGTYGLASLGQWAWNEYLHGVPVEQIMLDLRNTDAYKARFPAMQALDQAGHGISESQYISYENSIQQLNQQYGIAKGLFDTPQAIATLLEGNVSATEYDRRLQLYSQDAYNSPPQVQQLFQQWFGANAKGALVSYFADPNTALPELEKQFTAAQIGGAGALAGFNLTQAQALGLQAQGVTASQAGSGLTALGKLGDVNSLPVAGLAPLTADQLLSAQFGGNAADQKLIEARQAAVLGKFQGGGSYAGNSSGYAGIGSGNPT